MKKVANPSLSPAIQNAQMDMAGSAPEGSKEDIFKQLFTDRAYKSFTTKFPYLIDYVATFKILNENVDEGYAVGAFFLNMSQEGESVFMVPIILKNNNIQPIMFIYDSEMDLFLPMNQEWVDEILKRLEQNSGDLAKPDLNQLAINNSITGMSNVPYRNTGGLNSVINKLGSINIPEIVSGLDKEAKKKFFNIIESNEKVASAYFSRFELEDIKKSFQGSMDKEAEEIVEKEIVVITPKTPLNMIKKEFKQDHVVMDDIASRGYHLKDDRKTDNKMIVFTDHLSTLENPTKSGTYEVVTSTGKVVPVFIIQDPILMDQGMCDMACHESGTKDYKTYAVAAKNKCLVLFPDGNYTIMKNDNVLASPIIAESLSESEMYKNILGDKTSTIPLDKPFIFIKKQGNGYITTGPITVKTKTTEDGAVRMTTNFGNTAIIQSEKYKGNTLYVTNNGTTFVPESFKAVPLKEEVSDSIILGSMKTISMFMNNRLLERGGKPITIVKDERGEYGIESNRPMTKYKTIVKVAQEYNVNAKEVEVVLDEMDKKGSKICTTYILSKEAQTPMMDPMMQQQMMMQQQGMGMPQQGMPQQGMPQQGMPMDPAMGGGQQGMPMDPAMGGQQPMGMMDPSMQQMAPQMMDQGVDMASQMEDQGLFDTSALMSLAYISKLEDLFPKYLPNLIESLDNISRIILNFWINSNDIEEDIGVTEYENLENKLKTLHENLSDLLISLNKKIDIFAYK